MSIKCLFAYQSAPPGCLRDTWASHPIIHQLTGNLEDHERFDQDSTRVD